MSAFQEISKKEYVAYLKGPTITFKTFFDLPKWHKFLEKKFPQLKLEYYRLGDSYLLSIARLGEEKLVSLPFCEYGSSGVSHLLWGRDFEFLIKSIEERFGENLRISFHPYIFEYKSGLTNLPVYPPSLRKLDKGRRAFWIEDFSKKSRDDLWAGFRKTLRQEIKKSEQYQIDVAECKNDEELEQFYNLYVQTMKRHKNFPLPLSVFKFFAEENDARVYLAKKDGRAIGGSVFLFCKPFVLYFKNASDSKFRDWNVGHRILWHVLQKYVGGEYDYFDLGRTQKGSSLEVFKRGWGAIERPIYEIGTTKETSATSWKRRAWGMLPAFLMKRVSNLRPFLKYEI